MIKDAKARRWVRERGDTVSEKRCDSESEKGCEIGRRLRKSERERERFIRKKNRVRESEGVI